MFWVIAGAVAAIISAISTAIENENQREANSKAADAANEAAAQAEEKAANEAAAYEDSAKRLLAQQRANYAAAGFSVSGEENSPLTVLAQSSKTATEERNQILQYGQWEADALRTQADAYSDAAHNLSTSGWLGSAGSLLGGLSSAFSSYQSSK